MYTSNLRYQVPPKTGVLGGYTNGPPLSGTPKSVHFSIGLCCRFLSSETLNCNPPQIGGRGGGIPQEWWGGGGTVWVWCIIYISYMTVN